jgi:hypothetical protein
MDVRVWQNKDTVSIFWDHALDVEGTEDLVLRGFGKPWDDGNIGLAQFEIPYGEYIHTNSHHLLIDFSKGFKWNLYSW